MRNSYGLKRKGVDLSQGPPKRKRDVVQIPAVIDTPSVPAENPPSSSGWHSNVVILLNLMMSFLCTVFSWAFPSYTLKFDFSFLFLNFVWVLKIFLDPYNHDSLLSSQSIKRRRSSLDLNSQPTTSQPYLLATRVLECPQSFTSFLVMHFSLCLLSYLVVEIKTI
jgi:hypothetical protein